LPPTFHPGGSMRATGLAAVLLMLSTGCGGSDLSDRMTAGCLKDGDMTEAQCKCVADRAEKDLSKGAQEMIVAEMEDNRERVEELSKQMTMQDAATVGTFMMNAVGQCAMGQSSE
jgi:hypothetical protein